MEEKAVYASMYASERKRRTACEQDVEEGISRDAEKWMGTDWPCKAE